MADTGNTPAAEGRLGPYRIVHLSKIIDPDIESRRCKLYRHKTVVQGVEDYHTDMDITTHLGTHVEAPCHHGGLTKDVVDVPFDHYAARGVLLRLDSGPRALITKEDLDKADGGRVQPGDVVLLDSNYHAEPFAEDPNDQRPHLSRDSAEWSVQKKLKAVGFGDGICIESNIEHCNACHDLMLGNDILFIEVMKNLDKLGQEPFLIVFMPLPIRGLDSSPVNVIAVEGIPGMSGTASPNG